jgi:molybdate/tungstate transport system ATP-binding protein
MIDVKVVGRLGSFRVVGEIKDDGCICLSGLNGSGKSSLLNMIAGVHPHESGHVILGGSDVTRLPVERRGVVLVTPDSSIPHVEVDKHLVWGASVRKQSVEHSEISRTREALGITYNGRVDKLSLGMRERVSLATALLSGTKAILVDETFSNIDNKEPFMKAYFQMSKERGVDLIFTTQSESDARLADHHYSMKGGTSSRVY